MFFDSKPIKNYALVQVPTLSGTGGSFFTIPDQPELRGRQVEKIVAYNNEMVSATPSGQNVVTVANVNAAYLVLYVNEREDIKISLVHLISSNNASGTIYGSNNGYIPFANLNIVWSKSYVKVPNGTIVPAANQAFLFGVFYK